MRFGVLGPLVATDDEGHELPLGGPRQRAVLAILLLRVGEAVSSDRLIDQLWGEHPPATAAKTLQVYVSNLRRALGDGVILTRAGGYVVDAGRAEIDLARFDALAAEGHRELEAGRATVATQRLREGLALWRGPALADFAYESFAQADRARLEEARLVAVEDRIDAELALGNHAVLVGELEALVRINPLRERLSAQLMLALYRAERQADALDVYRRLRAHLAEELGLEPAPALKELQLQILAQAPSLTALDADIAGAARIARRGSIPRPPTSLVGRERDIDAVCGMLGATDARLVSLIGAGGIGKTRLAIAVAQRLADQFDGGMFLVRLAGVFDSASILPMIAEQVGVTGQSELPLLDVLRQRFADQPTLLVLDNFEQLVSGATVLADLLACEGSLRLLVTSQVPLRIAAERVFSVGPLAPQDALGLFIKRASAATGTFSPEGKDLAAIEAICGRLDCMPLAIELAAARVGVLGPRELERRLERPLELLTRGERDAPERQRSLRATVEWTHSLLDLPQQALLARLSVCVGQAPLPLVEVVAGGATPPAAVLDQLQALVEFSFARRYDDEVGTRFMIPQALRDFALERLSAAGEEDVVRRAHAGYVAEVARSARLWKWGATAEARRQLVAIGDEIRPAVAWAREHDPELHVRICADLSAYWVYVGVLSEVIAEFQHARDAGAGSAADRAWILTSLAKCVQLQGGANAVQLVYDALAEWQAVDDELERALAMGHVGWVLVWAGRYDETIELQQAALEVLRRSGDRALILRGLVFLAHAFADQEDVDATETVLQEADALAGGDPTWELTAVHADCAHARGDKITALNLYAESLAWSTTTGEAHQMLMDMRCVATELSGLGAGEKALEVFELVRLEEERTGRTGNNSTLLRWFGDAQLAARKAVNSELAERAVARARGVPIAERAAYIIELANASARSRVKA